MKPDEEVDRLYGLPLEEFTRARNALAARLKKDGDGDAAAEVKALAKPTVSAWTVNQLARRHEGEVRALLAAGDELRSSQSKGGDELRDALRRQRDAIARLTESARELLRAERGSASEATVQRVATTLRAVAAVEEASEQVARGRLTEDLEPTGFEALAGLGPPAATAKGSRRAAPDRRKVEAAKRRVRELKARAAELDGHADQAARKVEDSRRAVRRAERDAQDARAAADKAAAELAEAETELAALTSD